MDEIIETKQEPTASEDVKVNEVSSEDRKTCTDATGRLRDEKGHFIPNPDKTCTHDKKPKRTRKQKEDENTVKIRIVKDDVPPPDKDFEGRLEDMKERTATNFLKSVCYHKPRSINIDGLCYYSEDVVDALTKSLSIEKAECAKGLSTLKKAMDTIMETGKTLEDCYDSAQKVRRSRFLWRSIAIGALVTLISFCITTAIDKYNSANASRLAHVEQGIVK